MKGYVQWVCFMALCAAVPVAPAQQVTVASLPALIASTPIPGSQHAPADFNGDGFSDLAWIDPFTNQFGYWLMGVDGNGQVTHSASATFKLTAGYYVGAVGDFDGDGYADTVFTSAKRDLYLWTNDRSGRFASRYLATYPAGWQLLGAGDVDGNGQDDLLWYDADDCTIGVWLMRGGKLAGSRTQVVDCGYTVVAIGYFTPTPRISLARTNDRVTIQILDSTPAGFVASQARPSSDTSRLIGVGGGVAGQGIIAAYRRSYVDGATDGLGRYEMLDRSFDDQGNATGVTLSETWNGLTYLPWGIGGALVAGRGAIGASLVQNYGNGLIEACAPGHTEIPYQRECVQFTYPRDWFVVGAPANGAGTLGAEMTP